MTLSQKYRTLVEFLKDKLGVDKSIDVVLADSDAEFERLTDVDSTGVLGVALRGDEIVFSPLHQEIMDAYDGTVTADNEREVLAVKLVVHEMAHLLKKEPGWDKKDEQRLGEAVTEGFALRFMALEMPYEGAPQDYRQTLERTALYRDDVERLVSELQKAGDEPGALAEFVAWDGDRLTTRFGRLDGPPGPISWLWEDEMARRLTDIGIIPTGNIQDIAALWGQIQDIAGRDRGQIQDIAQLLGQIQDIAELDRGQIQDIARLTGQIQDIARMGSGQIQDIADLLGQIQDIARGDEMMALIAGKTRGEMEGEGAREEARAAQKKRGKRYGIAVLDVGQVTKPKQWENLDDDEFADPVNYRYPIHDAAHARNAAARFAQEDTAYRGRDVVRQRIEKALKKFKIGKYREDKSVDLAVKALGDGRVGGYACIWGSADMPDLSPYKDFFTPDTQLMMEHYDRQPMFYQHAQNDALGDFPVVGVWDTKVKDEIGAWYEGQLDLHHRYYAAIQKLIDDGAIRLSSDSAKHLIRREPQPNGTNKLLQWPIVAVSLTPTPAEPRLLPVTAIKAAYAALGQPFNLLESEGGEDPRLTEANAAQRLRLLQLETDLIFD